MNDMSIWVKLCMPPTLDTLSVYFCLFEETRYLSRCLFRNPPLSLAPPPIGTFCIALASGGRGFVGQAAMSANPIGRS